MCSINLRHLKTGRSLVTISTMQSSHVQLHTHLALQHDHAAVPYGCMLSDISLNTVLHLLDRYQHYLESVLEGADEFHEIGDLMLRHATLAATNQDLKDQRNHSGEAAEQIRSVRLAITVRFPTEH